MHRFVLAAGKIATTAVLVSGLGGKLWAQAWQATADNQQIKEIACSSDGTMIAAQCASAQDVKPRQWPIELRDAASGKLLRALGDGPGVSFVRSGAVFSPDGRTIASAVWRKQSGPLRELSRPATAIVSLWDTATGDFDRELIGNPQEGLGLPFWSDLLCCEYSPDGSLIAAAGKLVGTYPILGSHIGGEVCVWDVRTGKPLWQNRLTHTDIVYDVVFSPDGRLLASGGVDKLIRLWDPLTGELKQTLMGAAYDGVTSLSFSADGAFLASAGQGAEDSKRIRVWDVAAGRLVQSISYEDVHTRRVAFVADSTTLAVLGTLDSPNGVMWQVRSVNASDGGTRRKLAEGKGYAAALAITSAGDAFFVGTQSGELSRHELPK